MAPSSVFRSKRHPHVTPTGLVRVENKHMAKDIAPDEKVILEKYRHLYPDSIKNCTGRELAKNFPQEVTAGREATYFIPAGRLATLRGTAFALPRSTAANIRQALSQRDLHNRVHHNSTFPGCMIEAWDRREEMEKENEEYAARKAARNRQGK
jgi:hypothetical protein